MSKKLSWGLAILTILLGTVFVFVMQRERAEIRQLKENLAAAEKMLAEHNKAKQASQTPIDYSKPPPGKTFANGGHWHDGEWHDGPHNLPIVVRDVPKTEPVQMESVVIDGVGDLKEWLAFFESFGDDPPLEKEYEFTKKSIQYGESMREFDKKNASPEVLALIDQILEKQIALGYIFGAKLVAHIAEDRERRNLSTELPTDIGSTIAGYDESKRNSEGSDNNEGGGE